MELYHNKSDQRFEFDLEGLIAYIAYQIKEDKIYLISTQVPEILSGKGIGSKLLKATLEKIETMNLKIVPICNFIQSYFERHPELHELLA